MADSKLPKQNDDTMGITFGEIHSDEAHEAVDGGKAEVKTPHAINPDEPIIGGHTHAHDGMFDVARVFESETGDIGTIVRDKRKTAPTLSKGVGMAFGEWWGGIKHGLSKLLVPVEQEDPKTVTKAETRAHIVQKAIAPTAIPPKDDHRVIVEKFRTYKLDVARATGTAPVIKAPVLEKVGNWSHILSDDASPSNPTTQSIPTPKVIISDLRNSTIAPAVEKKLDIDITAFAPSTVAREKIKSDSLYQPSVSKTSAVIPAQVVPKIIPSITSPTLSVPTGVPISTSVTPHMPEKRTHVQIPGTMQKKEIPVIKATVHVAPEITHVSKPSQQTTITPVAKPVLQQQASFLVPSVQVPTSTPLKSPVQPMHHSIPKVSVSTNTEIPEKTWAHIIPDGVTGPVSTPLTKVPTQLEHTSARPRDASVPVSSLPVSQNTPLPRKIPASAVASEYKLMEPRIEAVKFENNVPKQTLGNQSEPLPIEEFHTNQLQSPQEMMPTKTPIPQKREFRPYTPAPDTSSTRSITKWLILVGIALVGVILAVVVSVYINRDEEPITEVAEETLTIPRFFPTDTENPIALETGGYEFLAILKERIASAESGVVQFYPTLPNGAIVRPATAEEVFSLLAVNLGGKVQRALSDTVMIGSITTTKNEPFVIMQSYNFDILFSGMLAWERDMYTDLSPLFATSGTVESMFTDAVQNNKSTRVLYDRSGTEVLLYSFVNQNTVVITSSSDALSKIIEKF